LHVLSDNLQCFDMIYSLVFRTWMMAC